MCGARAFRVSDCSFSFINYAMSPKRHFLSYNVFTFDLSLANLANEPKGVGLYENGLILDDWERLSFFSYLLCFYL